MTEKWKNSVASSSFTSSTHGVPLNVLHLEPSGRGMPLLLLLSIKYSYSVEGGLRRR